MSRLGGGEVEWLIADLELSLDCKIEEVELTAILLDYDTAINTLLSGIEEIDGRLEIFEGGWWVVQQVQQDYDCTLDPAGLTALLAGYDASFLELVSDIELLDGKLNVLEVTLAHELG
jgi:hypothetical protein